MKYLLFAVTLLSAASACAQSRVWKCDREYTRTAPIARQRGCMLQETGASSAMPSVMTIPDGHFRLRGFINNQPAMFLVDTGATYISVSDDFARRANLKGGSLVKFNTANGPRAGRLVKGVTVIVGSFSVASATVAVGTAGQGSEVLLGQNFLRNFDVTMNDRQVVIRTRTQ
ncbi:TIGR02281 family clan AA aspartic protease [Variovorax sp. dw_308]|uniref:retropepsin-like aspartic protease family protein n=1 Tax=Variovorax sp. dw_308 TaxID=2721546 RepID=UPI001C44E692|nr:retropepsin-like aspartic protease [Variovorax sp. dw_308]